MLQEWTSIWGLECTWVSMRPERTNEPLLCTLIMLGKSIFFSFCLYQISSFIWNWRYHILLFFSSFYWCRSMSLVVALSVQFRYRLFSKSARYHNNMTKKRFFFLYLWEFQLHLIFNMFCHCIRLDDISWWQPIKIRSIERINTIDWEWKMWSSNPL